MISCSKCKKATLPPGDGGCIKTGGIVDIGCEYGEPRVLTNYDALISKTPEEMATYLSDVADPFGRNCPCDPAWKCQLKKTCRDCTLDWLKQETTP